MNIPWYMTGNIFVYHGKICHSGISQCVVAIIKFMLIQKNVKLCYKIDMESINHDLSIEPDIPGGKLR